MKETIYHIKIHSIVRFITAFIVTLLSLTFTTHSYFGITDDKVLIFTLISVQLLISFYIGYWVGLGRAKIILSEDGISHVWVRKYFLSREKNVSIPWTLVDNFVFQKDRTFDIFIINLANKTRYKVHRLNFLPIKDDFYQLVKDFPKLANKYQNPKNKISSNTKQIKQGKTIYESKYFLWLLYILAIGFAFLSIDKLANPKSDTSWGAIGIIGLALLYYAMMIIKQKK